MKPLLLSFTALILLLLPSVASADVFSCGGLSANTLCWQPNPPDLDGLDHHFGYAWSIGGVNLAGKQITVATLAFKNIYNWQDNAPNKLFLHLLDRAKKPGGAGTAVCSGQNCTYSYQDSILPGEVEIDDDFNPANPQFASNPLVDNSIANTFLAAPSFSGPSSPPVNYVLDLIALGFGPTLTNYFNNGNDIAFGIDPDCHFFNDGITFQLTTTSASPVPEPNSMLLFGTAMATTLAALRRKLRR